VSEIKEADWAYAAGFVDGEGCIAIVRSFAPRRGRFYYSVQVVVTNRNRAVLDWLQQTWGGWVVAVSLDRTTKARPAWHWRCPTGQSAEPFLAGIGDYLRIKMPQLENALAMIELSKRSYRTLGPNPLPGAWLAEQDALYRKQRELNHRGTAEFTRKAMHSPRRINRERSSPPKLS
jgi:hypothetical protein